mgnify:FL=1|tara:strand:+ start:390 stop:1064 length:675 start_codon:yes stop_codon:yes gene_type:complete
MKKYIQTQKNKENYFTVSGIEITIQDPLSEDIDVKSIVKQALTIVPRILFKSIRKIKIGQFKELNDRDLDALYKDKIIYLTNLQESDADLLDDIIHEIAHSVEVEYSDMIYSDGSVRREFINKRLKLKKAIDSMGYQISLDLYKQTRYDEEFDMFLYKKVGYKKIAASTPGLFLSPYAATSLREYFAIGFENIFLNQESYQVMRRNSPSLFEKLINLISIEEEK